MGILAAGRFSVTDMEALATDLQYYVDVHIATLVALVLGFTVLPVRPERASRRASRPAAPWSYRRAGGAGGLDGGHRPSPRPGQQPDRGPRLRQHRPDRPARAPGALRADAHQGAAHRRAAVQRPLHRRPGDLLPRPGRSPPSWTRPPQRVVVLASGDVVDAHGETLQSVPIDANRVAAERGTLELRDGERLPERGRGRILTFELPAAARGPRALRRGHLQQRRGRRGADLHPGRRDRLQLDDRPQLPAGNGVSVVDRLDGTTIRKVVLPRSQRSRTCA